MRKKKLKGLKRIDKIINKFLSEEFGLTAKLNTDFKKKLDKGGYRYMYIETTGGHTWDNWRRYLIDFAPRLFKTQNKIITI